MPNWIGGLAAIIAVAAFFASMIVSNSPAATSFANAAAVAAYLGFLALAVNNRRVGKDFESPFLLAWVVLLARFIVILKSRGGTTNGVLVIALLVAEAWLLLRVFRTMARRRKPGLSQPANPPSQVG